jgi:ribosomal protein L29
MKRTAKAELRAKSVEDLTKEAAELRDGLFKGRIAALAEGKSIGSKRTEIRRHIARIETIITEKKVQA